ncbi:uncharacterized protein LOC123395680 [Hordeum vulgare subsp. vulgare]|uniref:uncharacterized protein LOC123395680 n=1 Tax=Hordeum vulgare subsp. vulgare TaxID=112509 RepID=UPI001D1A380F|nr:uncharacterized protein LOC123395680 [Hordeum vulgare subsp. vulgare]
MGSDVSVAGGVSPTANSDPRPVPSPPPAATRRRPGRRPRGLVGGCPWPPPLLRGARQAQRLRADTYVTDKFGGKVKKERLRPLDMSGVKFHKRIIYCIKRRCHLGSRINKLRSNNPGSYQQKDSI